MFPLHILQVSTLTEFTRHSSEHSPEWCMRRPFCFSWGIFLCVNMMDFEQPVVIKFLSEWNKTNVEIENTLFEVLGDAAYTKWTVQKWTKRFREAVLLLSNSTSQRKQRLPYPILRTLQTWVPVIFFNFCNSSGQWRGNGSRQQKVFNWQQKENYTKLHLPILNVVTNSGWNPGDTGWMLVANISKVTISFIVIIFWT